ncbi:MAG: hypothetical protein QXV17_14045 [Candidatus Micrarchaeaceae archaeon]
MKLVYKLIGFFALLLLVIDFAIPLGSAMVVTPDLMHGPPGGGGNSQGYYLSAPSFNFNPVPTPSLNININWSYAGGYFNPLSGYFNPVAGLEYIFGAIGNVIATFLGGYLGAIITNGALYIIEAVYWIFAYLEYLILSVAVSTAQGLGIWSLTVFVAVLMILVALVIMIIKIAQEAIMMGAGA